MGYLEVQLTGVKVWSVFRHEFYLAYCQRFPGFAHLGYSNLSFFCAGSRGRSGWCVYQVLFFFRGALG